MPTVPARLLKVHVMKNPRYSVRSNLRLLGAALVALAGAASSSLLAQTIWDAGAGADTSINNPTNWNNNIVNPLDGTVPASFGSGGNTATLNTAAYFTNVTFNRADPGGFTIAGPGNLVIKGSASGGNANLIVSSSATTNSTINAPVQVNTNGAGSLLVINNNKAATLAINSGISALSGTYAIRCQGPTNSITRIAGSISGLSVIQPAGGIWAGDVVIAGNQSLSGASITMNSGAGFGTPTATARLVLGESSADAQTWNDITLNNVMNLAVGGVITADAISGSGTARITGTGASGATLKLASGTIPGTVTVGGAGTGEDNLTLVKYGTVTLTINSGNTYAGGTVVENGSSVFSIRLGANEALGSGPLTVGTDSTGGNGARVQLAGYNQTVAALSSGTNSTRVVENGLDGFSTLTINQSSDTAYSGILRDNYGTNGVLAVIKSGAGLLDLSGASVGNTGGFEVNEGTVGFSSMASGNFAPAGLKLGGGTIKLIGTGTSANDTIGFDLTAATTSTFDITNAVSTVRLSGPITGSGDLNKTGAGVLALGTNGVGTVGSYFSGTLDIQGGTVQARSSDSLGSTAGGTVLSGAGARLNLDPRAGEGVTYDAEPLTLGTDTGLRNELRTNTWQGTITLTGAAGIVADDNTALTLAGGIATGGNTLTVGDTNNLGRVILDSTVSGGGSVTVANGTLGGQGTVGSSLIVQVDGTLSPGTSIGQLTVNSSVTLGGTTVMEITKDGGLTNDVVAAPGQTMTLGGTLVVTHIGATALAANDTFQLFQAGTFSGNFAGADLPALPAGLDWDASQLGTLGQIQVVAAPSTPPIPGYSIVTFYDGFNGVGIDTDAWRVGDGYSVPGGRTNVSVSSGNLYLNTSKDGTNWITGWVNTREFVHKYGVWVSRYRIAQTNGLNNAFWTATVGGNPWDDIEIDINEGHWPYGTLDTLTSHVWYHPVPGSNTLAFGAKPAYDWTQYHTNVLEWRADNSIHFYLDGVKYTSSTTALNACGVMAPQDIIFSTHYFDWAGPGDGLTNTSMDVDWVQVFQKPGWSGAVSGSWTNAGNWGADGVPGTNFAALFNQASPNTTVTLPSDRYCQSLYFDTPQAPSFTLAAGNSLHLGGSAAGARGGVILGSGLTNSQTINVAIVAERELEFGNYSTTPGVTLDLNGTITGTAGGRHLYFCGGERVNLNSSLPASISDLRRFGEGEVWLNAANNHTGTNYVMGAGRIIAPVDGALGASGTRSYAGYNGGGGSVFLANGVNYTTPHTIHLNDNGYYVGSTLYPVFGVADTSEVTFGGSVVVEKNNAPLGAVQSAGVIHLTGVISGASSNTLSLVGSGTVSLEGNSTFAGPIESTVNTLAGNGTVRGPVTVTNRRLNPGTPAALGTLTISNSLTLLGSYTKTTFRINKDGGPVQDRIAGITTLTCAGSLTVTNIGLTEPVAGDSFQLFAANSIVGSFDSLTLPSLTDTNLSWNTNNLYTTGTISVSGTAPPQPTILPVALDGTGTNLLLRVGTDAAFEYVLETTTNLAPVVIWTPVQTNAGTGGVVTNLIPVSKTTPKRFYRYEAR